MNKLQIWSGRVELKCNMCNTKIMWLCCSMREHKIQEKCQDTDNMCIWTTVHCHKYQYNTFPLSTPDIILWQSESASGKCALHSFTLTASNNKDHMPWSFHYCLFAPHIYGCCSSHTFRLWWIAHSMQRQPRGCNNSKYFQQSNILTLPGALGCTVGALGAWPWEP